MTQRKTNRINGEYENPAKSIHGTEKKEQSIKPKAHLEKKVLFDKKGYRTVQKNLDLKMILRFFRVIFKVLFFLLLVLICGLGFFLHEGLQWVFDTWSNLNMEEIMYQLQTPVEGTNSDIIQGFVDACLSPTLIAIIAIVIVLLVMEKRKYPKKILLSVMIASSVILSAGSIYSAWKQLEVSDYIENQAHASKYIENHYADPQTTTITFPEQKRNLIYIFMESMEMTYSNSYNGGGFQSNYIPELTELAKNNINFSNTDKLGGLRPTTGATWTMGGMFAQTAGLPLKAEAQFGAYDVASNVQFLPAAYSLGQILEKEGYTQAIMFGSEGKFAGRQNYFEQHGNYAVWDLEYAQGREVPTGYHDDWWGYEDEYLFDFAKKKLLELSSDSQPFNLTMLTVDTHFEDGHICELCDDKYGDNQYANVIACSSRQVSEFVNWIQEQSFYDNTTIVLVGDHLTMDTDFCDDISPGYIRTVYNCFINSAVTTDNTKNRVATTMDMFPTTLASMGVQIDGDRLGLGTNLFSDKMTLAEDKGFDALNSQLKEKSTFFEKYAGGTTTPVIPSILDFKKKLMNQEIRVTHGSALENITAR